MRVFEFLLFIVGFSSILLMIYNKKKLYFYNISTIFGLFIAHSILEGTRWQLYPLYVSLLFLLILQCLILLKNLKYKLKMSLVSILSFVIICSLILSIILPVFQIPEPDGDFSIGTKTYEVTDSLRKAIYSDRSSENRHIKYQVWYPAHISDSDSLAPWLEEGTSVSTGISRMMAFPDFALRHTELVQSNSYSNAELNNDINQFPVIILSHGWTGFRAIHTNIAELLSSHGFIVISIDHTYGSAVTVFDDGEVAYLNRDALPNRETTDDFIDYANTLVGTYSRDIQLVISELESHNQNPQSFFYGKLNLNELGLLGHSTGGGAAIKTAINDSRVKVVMGLDPWVEPLSEDTIRKVLNKPGLFLRSAEWENHVNNDHLGLLHDMSNNSNFFQINGTIHTDFTMAPMFSPLTQKLGMAGTLDYKQSFTIQKDLILNFFLNHLNDANGPLPKEIDHQYNNLEEINFQNED